MVVSEAPEARSSPRLLFVEQCVRLLREWRSLVRFRLLSASGHYAVSLEEKKIPAAPPAYCRWAAVRGGVSCVYTVQYLTLSFISSLAGAFLFVSVCVIIASSRLHIVLNGHHGPSESFVPK